MPARMVGSSSAPFRLPPCDDRRAVRDGFVDPRFGPPWRRASLIIGPTAVAGSRGIADLQPARRLDQQRRESDSRTCPARTAAASTCTPARRAERRSWRIRGAARSRSASSQTIVAGDAAELERDRAAGPTERCSCLPTSVLPVKEKKRTSRFSTSQRPTSAPGPCTRVTWPGGRPASSSSSKNSAALNGVALRRLRTTVLPDASAGADLVRHQVERRVERRNAADDAARDANRERHAMGVARAPLRSARLRRRGACLLRPRSGTSGSRAMTSFSASASGKPASAMMVRRKSLATLSRSDRTRAVASCSAGTRRASSWRTIAAPRPPPRRPDRATHDRHGQSGAGELVR